MAKPAPRDRPQPPLAVRGSRVAFTPAFVWEEWDEPGPNGQTERRRERMLPPAATARAEAVEQEIRKQLTALGHPLPPAGDVAARVLRVAAAVPPADRQTVIATVKESPPFWGVTTRRARG